MEHQLSLQSYDKFNEYEHNVIKKIQLVNLPKRLKGVCFVIHKGFMALAFPLVEVLCRSIMLFIVGPLLHKEYKVDLFAMIRVISYRCNSVSLSNVPREVSAFDEQQSKSIWLIFKMFFLL